jgi:hypothetical protein
VKRLLETFFAGFGISAAVGIFIIPFSSRDIVSMRMTEELRRFKSVLEAQSQFMLSLPSRDWYSKKDCHEGLDARGDDRYNSPTRLTPWPEADALKKMTTEAAEELVKIQSELRYEKREAGWAKLGPEEYENIYQLLKYILLPILGMESLTQVADRVEKRGGWTAVRAPKNTHSLTESELNALEEKEKEQWQWIFDQLRGPVRKLQQAMMEGLDHALYTLELAKRPRSSTKSDIEANVLERSPGEKGFAVNLENRIQEFLQQREGPLKEWCTSKGMDDPSQRESTKPSDYPLHQRHQSQLYLVLDVSLFL